MGEVLRNGLSLWRWKRWVQVRVLGRWQLRHFWPSPADIERMTTEERETWFKSIGLDESIARALEEIEETRDQGLVVAAVSSEEALAQRLGSTQA